MRKFALLDIDGVILPAKPDPSLPYMRRLEYLKQACDCYLLDLSLHPHAPSSLPKDGFDRRTTTDLGHAMHLIDPDWDKIEIRFEEQLYYLADLRSTAGRLVRQSEIYYKNLVGKTPDLKYEPLTGAVELVAELGQRGWKPLIISGNPYYTAVDKILRSGLSDIIGETTPGFRFGEDSATRDRMVLDLLKMTGMFSGDRFVYVGDRISDAGLVHRLRHLGNIPVTGVLIPSFDINHPDYYRVAEMSRSGELFVVNNLADKTTREGIFEFIETRPQINEGNGMLRK